MSFRILHVTSHLDVRMGGSILAALQIADATHGDGFECTVVGTTVPGSGSDQYFRDQFPRLHFEAFPMQFPRHSFHSTALRRWLALRTAAFGLVHVHGLFNFPYLFGGRAAIRAGRPLVISPHNSLDPYDLRKKAALKRYVYGPWFARPMLAGASYVLCSTVLEAQRLETYGVQPAPAKVVIPYPVPAPRAITPDGSWRRKNGLSCDHVVILFLSRFDRKKGLDLLVPAFLRVAGRRPEVRLALAGGGEGALVREMKRLIETAGMADRVRWVGFVTGDEKVRAYQESDLFALPSYNENFGLVVVEAMYAGIPVLISREVYLHEAVARHGCAVICDTTVGSVESCLERLIENPEERRQMGARAPGAAEVEFSPAVVQTRLRGFYEGCLASRGSGAGGFVSVESAGNVVSR